MYYVHAMNEEISDLNSGGDCGVHPLWNDVFMHFDETAMERHRQNQRANAFRHQ